MFIKDSVIKKLIKKAFEKNELVIAHEEGLYTIQFGNCVMQVIEKYMTNRVKSILVDFVGDIPKNEGMLYGEGCEPQIHLDAYDDLREMFERKSDNEYEGTCVSVNRCKDVYRVMQLSAGTDKVMVKEEYISIVDHNSIDLEGGEIKPGLPRLFAHTLIWSNNVMSLRVPVGEIKYQSEKNILGSSYDLITRPEDYLS